MEFLEIPGLSNVRMFEAFPVFPTVPSVPEGFSSTSTCSPDYEVARFSSRKLGEEYAAWYFTGEEPPTAEEIAERDKVGLTNH